MLAEPKSMRDVPTVIAVRISSATRTFRNVDAGVT
jgi:hypothetical protein